MGASIQCANKNCFVAFHVTCARRARLFLKMKSNHGGLATLDSSSLKAYCDKHVPSDWRRDQRVDDAFYEAQQFYRSSMRDKIWADSQAAAVSYISQTPQHGYNGHHGGLAGGSPNKRKRGQIIKATWKLPSGAPVIPISLFNTVESSLSRFAIRKRKEYAIDACKYWTLKREARRGAALLKRLQLQMDTFSSMEITRRDFTAMGAAGRLKLLRRIEFATQLKQDLEKLRILCDEVKRRERDKLIEAEMLRDVVDMVYFPITPLLWPIFEKAVGYDGKGLFSSGFHDIRYKLETRAYTSVSVFTADLLGTLEKVVGKPMAYPTRGDSTSTAASSSRGLTLDQKESKKVAGRIIRSVHPLLAEAKRKELELGGGKPYEKELQHLEEMFTLNSLMRNNSVALSADDEPLELVVETTELSNGHAGTSNGITNGHIIKDAAEDAEMADSTMHETTEHPSLDQLQLEAHRQSSFTEDQLTITTGTALVNGDAPMSPKSNTKVPSAPEQSPASAPDRKNHIHPEPPSPPSSSDGNTLSWLVNGGIPWYLQPFDPHGIMLSEERWTGMEVLRGMSEELSELDEEEMQGLEYGSKEADDGSPAIESAGKKRSNKKGKSKRWR
jgi:NuA3 HAT complex component NTO1